MFEFFFKYPIPVFTKGRYLLLGSWPGWVLVALIVASAGALGWLVWRALPEASPRIKGAPAEERRPPLRQTWRVWVIWALEAAMAALLLTLLWQPAITVAELKSQQNIIAVVVDDSRSMAIADAGPDGKAARETAAVKALAEIVPGLEKRFQVREYRLDSGLVRMEKPDQWRADAPATHIGAGLEELARETNDLPLGAVVLLSDGAENGTGGADSGGISVEAINALHNRRLPVHTIGFGRERAEHDVELDDVQVAATAMAGSRMTAMVNFHQDGYTGQKATLDIRDGDKLLATRDVTLEPNGVQSAVQMFFNAGDAGVKNISFGLEPMAGEESTTNNAATRLVDVSPLPKRILYVEGEPRWQYKFLRRAEQDDKGLHIVSMLRTTENKIYRQGISDPSELADGFPTKAEDLFQYDAIILGSVEAGYFTPVQQELLREFVDRRGGGILFLGGRYSLGDGGWASSSLADLFPTFLPNSRGAFHRDAATVALTPAGVESPVTRLLDDKTANAERWRKLPALADYEDPGSPKPGATVLAQMTAGRTMPLLVTQNFGHGRTAVLASSGTWRWQMLSPLGDPSHDLFWQQLLRWLAKDSPGQVTAAMPERTLMDDGRVHMTAVARGKDFQPAVDAKVQVHVIGPEGQSEMVDMTPVPNQPGTFAMDWTAAKPGSYVAEVSATRGAGGETLGSDVVSFRREDGVAENFHTQQNRALLEKLSDATGGRYWKESELERLPKEISYSEAGISVRDTKELWDMPIVFLVLLGLMAADWLLRRKWGVV
ncbi:MAG TPA: glutamine amidotransferase [Acidobacteriaceae bacterium]|nr:glutamine amidotransferase [Acidobacteriaceae bacterium]